MNTRVLLADDHRIVREGLVAMLERERDMEVVQQASNGREALKAVRELRPDVVVMDVTMPDMNGIEATRRIVADLPQVKVLCLSVHAEKQFVSASLDVGASGYLLKDCAFEELVRAIRTLVADEIYLSPRIAGTVVAEYRARRPAADASRFSQLTDRERDIVQLLAEGHSTKEIAARLNVSAKTVGSHREHLMAKLRIRSMAELTKYAVREGLTSLDL